MKLSYLEPLRSAPDLCFYVQFYRRKLKTLQLSISNGHRVKFKCAKRTAFRIKSVIIDFNLQIKRICKHSGKLKSCLSDSVRKSREGWPTLTVET